MYDSILVGTDGSGAANRAVVHALDQAELTGATLHAIFVVDTSRYSEPALSSMELVTDSVEDWGHEQLTEVVERAEDLDVDVVTRSCHGKPNQEIISYADEIDADLVVLGYQGQSHTDPEHIGSITNRVIQNIGRPVMII
jgi:nucleotide-binding universal stress UspA family protein